jgi:lipoprotein-anchoring transpeptidase ErfK/SrfK
VCSSAAAQQVSLGEGSVVEAVTRLRSGEFVWTPEIAPAGPMLLLVNVRTQRAILYRNGVPIGATTVSTGKPGHETPTGVFTVLQKQIEHYSSKYDNAPMPYMQRLTWGGVALHAGSLPGRPASHGCIRLPRGFAQLLYKVTTVGMTVVIADQPAAPRIGLMPLGGPTLQEGAASEGDWHPEKSPQGPVSIIVSAADRRAVVLRNGIEIGSAPVSVDGPVAGTWAYALRSTDSAGQHWLRLQLAGGSTGQPVAKEEWQKFRAPESFKRAVAKVVSPGTTIVVTSDSLRMGATGTPVMVIEDAPREKER